MNNQLSIYCDGGSRGNPGPAAFAFVVIRGGKIIYSESQFIGKTTNNVAEYKGVRQAMRWIVKNDGKFSNPIINFFLDSQLIVKQMSGEYKIKDAKLIPLAKEIKDLEKKVDIKINFNFIKREKNKIADKLLNEKLDEFMNA